MHPAERAVLHARMRERGLKLGWLAGADTSFEACAGADLVLCSTPAVLAQLQQWLQDHPSPARPVVAVLEAGDAPAQLPGLFDAAAH